MARGYASGQSRALRRADGGGGYGIYCFVGPEVTGGNGFTVHAYIKDATGLATRSRVTIAGIPVGDARLDQARERRGAPRRQGQERRRALRQRDARQEERVAARRERHRAHAGHARPPEAARWRRDPRHRQRDDAAGSHGGGQGDRRLGQGGRRSSSRTAIGTEQGGTEHQARSCRTWPTRPTR